MSRKGKKYLRTIKGFMSNRTTYQLITVLSEPFEKEISDEIRQVVEVDIIDTSPKEKVAIYKSDRFSDFEEGGENEIISADSEEYKKKIKRVSKLFIKRLFEYGVNRR